MKPSLRLSPDFIASVILIAIWGLFFWRLFTPNPADRRMLIEGDFSGQFYMFGAYQYDRMSAGEVPLWNPYNNGGLPFIADTLVKHRMMEPSIIAMQQSGDMADRINAILASAE
ncbi:hypothetical protein HC928_25200 [bacterium]|nr:hypothetical protein [bacterium]